MLELIKAIFGQSDRTFLNDAYDRFHAMLDSAIELLEKEDPHLLSDTVPDELKEQARSIDKRSNKQEREIRKLLVEHLAFDPSHSSACLVLMSAAKDAERLVDVCRSLLLLAEEVKSPIPEKYRQAIRERSETLIEVLRQTRASFAENDRAKALEIVEKEKPFNASLTELQKQVIGDESLTVRQGILVYQALALLRRIRAIVGNIASTVVLPLHRIDFARKKYVKEARQELEKEGES